MLRQASPTRWSIVAEEPGSRLDRYLSKLHPDRSRSYIQKLIIDGYVRVNGGLSRANAKVKQGDRIEVAFPLDSVESLKPASIPLSVVYEDEDVLVVDKPPGISTHPGSASQNGTLANGLLARYPDLGAIGDPQRPGIVHRLDKDTSGLLIVAKSNAALEGLSRQFKARSVTKRYITLVKGRVESDEGVIEAPIGRSAKHRKRMAVVTEGRQSVTRYKVLKRLEEHTLLEVSPKTGRTHQVRVHLAAIGHPVAGDTTYGSRHPALERQFLHASFLGFQHPVTDERIELTSELPDDLNPALFPC